MGIVRKKTAIYAAFCGLAAIFFSAQPGLALDLQMPCWQNASCFSSVILSKPKIDFMTTRQTELEKRLDRIELGMRKDADYSIIFFNQKDRVPKIQSPEAQRAVDELAGSVLSAFIDPLRYRITLITMVEEQQQIVNTAIHDAIPDVQMSVYSLSFKPRVNLSQTNPVSLDVRLMNGRMLGQLSVRIREAELLVPLFRGVDARAAYSFRDSSWSVNILGRIPIDW